MQPMIVRTSPRDRCVRMPTDSMRSRMWSISASVTWGFVMMIILRWASGDGRWAMGETKTTREHSHGSLGWFAAWLTLARTQTPARDAGRVVVVKAIGVGAGH